MFPAGYKAHCREAMMSQVAASAQSSSDNPEQAAGTSPHKYAGLACRNQALICGQAVQLKACANSVTLQTNRDSDQLKSLGANSSK
jgi:hypothetical protein